MPTSAAIPLAGRARPSPSAMRIFVRAGSSTSATAAMSASPCTYDTVARDTSVLAEAFRGRLDGVRKHLPLIGICLGYFMVILDATAVNVALPDLGRELQGDVAGLQMGGRRLHAGVRGIAALRRRAGRPTGEPARLPRRPRPVHGRVGGVCRRPHGRVPRSATAAIIEAAPAHHAGIAAGVLNASRQAGGTLGVAVLGTLIAGASFIGGLQAAMAVAGGAFFAAAAVVAVAVRRPRAAPARPARDVAQC